MELSERQKRYLRALGHRLQPVVRLGAAGASEAVVQELDRALAHHELLKVKVRAADRRQRDALLARLCEATGAALVLRIGHTALLYRPRPEDPRIKLPPP
ncbi:MAG: ribosome assembly RNA-binding protein YhbY [Gammaproteobacteria bacterium]|nr:MAG: ribosome assembly RNA-binding protein YhbY [Gammaproteobacteria bacterium]